MRCIRVTQKILRISQQNEQFYIDWMDEMQGLPYDDDDIAVEEWLRNMSGLFDAMQLDDGVDQRSGHDDGICDELEGAVGGVLEWDGEDENGYKVLHTMEYGMRSPQLLTFYYLNDTVYIDEYLTDEGIEEDMDTNNIDENH